ncbi:MAG TPA: MotE family protein [Ensifer sp.]|nr:MotE family protein [Ensifer sp.]
MVKPGSSTFRTVFRLSNALVLLATVSAMANDTPAAPPANASIDEIQQYCSNVVDPARDRRYLMQKQDLEKLKSDVDVRLKALEERRNEYQDWLKKRNDFMDMARQDLVDIYKNMKPDAAAPRLAEVDVYVAAAILMKLTPRQAGLIMSEMDPAKAAKLTGLISSAAAAPANKG